jgi:molybdenum cofactor synthesis domain-containing protein
MRVAILTVSDSVMKGTRDDLSGDAIADWCAGRGDIVVKRDTVTDETSLIVPLLVGWCDSGEIDLVLTTGGTGLSPRDVTPEATRAVIERDANGIAEYLRATSFMRFPRAALSRGVAGVRAKTLVINLPGSPSGVKDSLTALDAIIDHAVAVLSGEVTQHSAFSDDSVSSPPPRK